MSIEERAPGTANSQLSGGRDAELRDRIRRELRSIQPRKLPMEWDDDARFREDLGLDSLDLVEMVARLEQLTGIFVPDPDVPTLTSVTSTAEYVRARQSAGAHLVP